MTTTQDQFPTDITRLPEACRSELVELGDGDQFDLRIVPVAKRLGEATVRMLAYNGSIPGPTLKVREGSEVVVDIENRGDLEATVHWHGLRLENRYDGTHQTQQPMAIGERFSAQVTFPDPGVYWYHPHIREDSGQEMGLYGNVLVESADPDYWPPVHRELALTLDDILLDGGKVAPFTRTETTHSAMGRFGNVLLVGGETDPSLQAKLGEVIRFFVTNTANTRVFRVTRPGARIKLVGGDSGRVEHEQLVQSVVLAPSERGVIDVQFNRPGKLTMEHHTPARVYRLMSIEVAQEPAEPALDEQFRVLRTSREMAAERERVEGYLDAEPDKTLAFVAEMDMGAPGGDAPDVYSCPMHPAVGCDEPGHCPECGMKLLPAQLIAEASGHHDHADADERHTHDHGSHDGAQWRHTIPASTGKGGGDGSLSPPT